MLSFAILFGIPNFALFFSFACFEFWICVRMWWTCEDVCNLFTSTIPTLRFHPHPKHRRQFCIHTQQEDLSFDVFSLLDWTKNTPKNKNVPTQITPKQSPVKSFELEQLCAFNISRNLLQVFEKEQWNCINYGLWQFLPRFWIWGLNFTDRQRWPQPICCWVECWHIWDGLQWDCK